MHDIYLTQKEEHNRVRLSSVDRQIPDLQDFDFDDEEAEDSDEDCPMMKINHADSQRISSRHIPAMEQHNKGRFTFC